MNNIFEGPDSRKHGLSEEWETRKKEYRIMTKEENGAKGVL